MAKEVRGKRLTLSPSGDQLYKFGELIERGKKEFGLRPHSVSADVLRYGMEAVTALMDEGKYGRQKKTPG